MAETEALSSRLENDGRSWIRLSDEQRRARGEFLAAFGRSSYRRLEVCPACDSPERVLIARKDRFGLPADNHLCRGCGLVYKDPVLSDEANALYYDNISARLRGKELSETARAALFAHRALSFAARRFEFIHARAPRLTPGALVVELGTYDGANLAPFHEAGYRTLGLDIDDGAFGPGRSRGLDLRVGTPESAALSEKSGLVLLSHFVEHLSRPIEQLRAIRALLPADGGLLFVEVPGLRTEGARDLLGYIMAEHNFSFDLTSLTALLGAAGFERLAGDELVQGLFRPGPVCDARRPEAGRNLLSFLTRCESWYRGWNARAVYHALRVLAVNEIYYRAVPMQGEYP